VLQAALVAQVAQWVEWGACSSAVAERQPSCMLEIGGGHTPARMWSARQPQIPARSLEDFRSAAGAASWVTRQL